MIQFLCFQPKNVNLGLGIKFELEPPIFTLQIGYAHNTNYCEYLFVNLIDIGHPFIDCEGGPFSCTPHTCSPHVFLPSKSVPHTFSCLPIVFPKFIVNEWGGFDKFGVRAY